VGDFMTEVEINKDFCFDSSKKLTIEIAHKALKTYFNKFEQALKLEESTIPIILDTNVLLRYYGMSQHEKKKLIEFLNKNKDRIFLTSQVQEEFLRNRVNVINKDFFQPLKAIPEDFKKMYTEVRNIFTSFRNNKKKILKDYPAIWDLLSEKEQKLEEIFGDEETLNKRLVEEIEIMRMDYKNIYFLDELLETCMNLKVTPALSDQEIDFIKKQYNMLVQKYKDVVEKSEKKKIMFPGWGDKPQKEDPSGDFIIFHELLKFMRGGKDGLNNTDVIFFTRDERKGDWFDEERFPIIHYIEKAFLLTDKSLFIIHPDKLLEISFENIHKNNQLEIFPENWSEDKLYKFTLDGSLYEHYMAHYHGWTILVSRYQTDEYWNALGVNSICHTIFNFIDVVNDFENPSLRVISKKWLTKEQAYMEVKSKIDVIIE
jgi:predicted nucleic acid-binding protein